jgi:hypothetical protein
MQRPHRRLATLDRRGRLPMPMCAVMHRAVDHSATPLLITAGPLMRRAGCEQLTVRLVVVGQLRGGCAGVGVGERVSGCTYSPPQRSKSVSREGADGSLTLLRCQHLHRRTPYEKRHPTPGSRPVIGRRAQGHKAWRREGVTCTRPEDRVVRATNQAMPHSRRASTSCRHRPGTRGTKSRPPGRARTRQLGRATVTPAPANTGQLHQ